MSNNNKNYTLMDAKKAEEIVRSNVKKRRRKDIVLKSIGQFAIFVALSFLVFLFVSIFAKGIPGFFQHYVTLEVNLDQKRLDPKGDLSADSLYSGDARKLVLEALYKEINPKGRKQKKAAKKILSSNAEIRVAQMVLENPSLLGKTIPITFALDDDIDSFLRGYIKRDTPESDRRINNTVIKFVDVLVEKKLVDYKFSDYILSGSASRSPEIAGVKGALIGSILTLFVCFILSFPIGVATAIYLEGFAPKNRITEIIEININNLAAVPSVVFGILGLAIFIGVFGMQRSIPLVGGMVLGIMTLPTIIISSRAAISAVPPSILDAAYGVGASKLQTMFHHVIPLAIPGMLTGTIIGMARALGETAPLLMIGMVAFIVDIPNSIQEPATVLPVQIFMWADFAERMFVNKTSSATIILLVFLILMNGIAIFLRNKLERRW